MLPEGLVCPQDKHPLVFHETENYLECRTCPKKYPIEDGIPIFLNVKNLSQQSSKQHEIYNKKVINAKFSETFLNNPVVVNHIVRKKYMDMVKLNPMSMVLELGTQFGDHLIYLSQKYHNVPKHNFYGIDIALNGLKLAKGRVPGINYLNCDIAQLPFSDNHFDVIIFCGILEHLSNPEVVLSEVSRVMKKNGVVTAYYAVKDYQWTLQYLLVDILKLKGFSYRATEAIGHDFRIIKTFAEYQKDFSANGLKLIKGERTNAIFQSLCDMGLIMSMKIASVLKKYFVGLFSNGNNRKNCGSNESIQICTSVNLSSSSRLKSSVRKIFSVFVSTLYYVLALERLLFKSIGVSFAGLYKKVPH